MITGSGVGPAVALEDAANLVGAGQGECERIVVFDSIHEAVDEPGNGEDTVSWNHGSVGG